MKIYNLKSHAKINLTLNVIGKFSNKMHKIESIICFIDLADKIRISESKSNTHRIIFEGKFSKGIPRHNSVLKVLNLLDKNNSLKGKKYTIKIKKNIPQKSGMGGGSMNAATIINFFLKKKFIKFSDAKKIANKVGSDVFLGINNNSKVLFSDNSFKDLKFFFAYYIILLKPNFGCSTKKVYQKNKIFTKKQYFKKKMRINENLITEGKNDLENSAFKIYPNMSPFKNRLLSLKKGEFIRMTGSGSTFVVYFKTKVLAKNAFKIYKKKLNNNNWCFLSKII